MCIAVRIAAIIHSMDMYRDNNILVFMGERGFFLAEYCRPAFCRLCSKLLDFFGYWRDKGTDWSNDTRLWDAAVKNVLAAWSSAASEKRSGISWSAVPIILASSILSS